MDEARDQGSAGNDSVRTEIHRLSDRLDRHLEGHSYSIGPPFPGR